MLLLTRRRAGNGQPGARTGRALSLMSGWTERSQQRLANVTQGGHASAVTQARVSPATVQGSAITSCPRQDI